MLVDLQYNLKKGIQSFPKFVKAVITKDFDTMSKEYKRFWTDNKNIRRELTDRNNRFKKWIDEYRNKEEKKQK